jgi:hypothetical protein
MFLRLNSHALTSLGSLFEIHVSSDQGSGADPGYRAMLGENKTIASRPLATWNKKAPMGLRPWRTSTKPATSTQPSPRGHSTPATSNLHGPAVVAAQTSGIQPKPQQAHMHVSAAMAHPHQTCKRCVLTMEPETMVSVDRLNDSGMSKTDRISHFLSAPAMLPVGLTPFAAWMVSTKTSEPGRRGC